MDTSEKILKDSQIVGPLLTNKKIIYRKDN